MLEKVKASTRIGPNGKKTTVKAHTRQVKGKGNTSVVRHPRRTKGKSSMDNPAFKGSSNDPDGSAAKARATAKELAMKRKEAKAERDAIIANTDYKGAKEHAKTLGLKYDGVDEDGLHTFLDKKGDVAHTMTNAQVKATPSGSGKKHATIPTTGAMKSAKEIAKRNVEVQGALYQKAVSEGRQDAAYHYGRALDKAKAELTTHYSTPLDSKTKAKTMSFAEVVGKSHGFEKDGSRSKKTMAETGMVSPDAKKGAFAGNNKKAAASKHEKMKDQLALSDAVEGAAGIHRVNAKKAYDKHVATHGKLVPAPEIAKKADAAKGRASALASMAKGAPKKEAVGLAGTGKGKTLAEEAARVKAANAKTRATIKADKASGNPKLPVNMTKAQLAAAKLESAKSKIRAAYDKMNAIKKNGPEREAAWTNVQKVAKRHGKGISDQVMMGLSYGNKTKKVITPNGTKDVPVAQLKTAAKNAAVTQRALNKQHKETVAKSVTGSKPTVAGSQFSKAKAMKAAKVVKSIVTPTAHMKTNRKNEKADKAQFGPLKNNREAAKMARDTVKVQTESRGKKYFTTPTPTSGVTKVKRVAKSDPVNPGLVYKAPANLAARSAAKATATSPKTQADINRDKKGRAAMGLKATRRAMAKPARGVTGPSMDTKRPKGKRAPSKKKS